MRVSTTKCASCVDSDSPDYDPTWDTVGCIDGDVYGFCTVDHCGGLCELLGRCGCPCHTALPAKERE